MTPATKGDNTLVEADALTTELRRRSQRLKVRCEAVRALLSMVWPAPHRSTSRWGLLNTLEEAGDTYVQVQDTVPDPVPLERLYRTAYRLEADADAILSSVDGVSGEAGEHESFDAIDLVWSAGMLLSDVAEEAQALANDVEHHIRTRDEEVT